MQNVQNNLLKGFENISISTTEIIPRLPVALVAILAGYIIIKVLGRILKVSMKWTKWPLGLQSIVATLLRAAMWVFLLITVLQVLGLTSVALAITGSFAVLLLGFSNGVSATVADLMSGLQLANDKDFKVGYQVKAGDQKTIGIVREMDIKKTRIEDEDGHIHVIPNSVIEKNEWVVVQRHVHSKMPKKSSAIINKVSSKIKKESSK